jgi:hypothetical protein
LTQESVPSVLDAGREANRILARLKKSAAKSFRWTRQDSLWGAADVAYLLHVLGRDGDALKAAHFLAQYQFAGNFNLWSAVECVLALTARLERQRSRQDEAAECVRRIRQAGFVSGRLDGITLRRHAVAVKDAIKTRELACRVRMGQELCVMIELGGSKKYPVPDLEKMFRENADRLRALLESPGAAPSPKRGQGSRLRAQAKEAKPKPVSRRPQKRE